MAEIPAQIADISLEWLNEVLAGTVGTVESFSVERLGEGVGILGELARLHLTYTAGGTGPASLIAKCQSPAPENQFLGQVMGFYLREVNFYREVASTLDIRVPAAYHVDASETGVPFVLLIEDIVGSHCPDQITGITPDEAGRILDVAAQLHARFWGSPELDAMTWLPPMNNPLYKAGRDMALARWPGFEERFGERVGTEMMSTVKRACDAYVELLDHAVSIGTPTFTHTDCRAENYLFGGSAGADAVTMIDFQLATRHIGPWDLANLLGGSMDPDVRRANEHVLVERYVARLRSLGVADYSVERCWTEMRWCLLQMCTASVIVSDLQGGNERGAELLENLFLRPVIAATDHCVGELLEGIL